MTDEVKVLSDDALREIDELQVARKRLLKQGKEFHLETAVWNIDTLCATVRALRADYALVENYVAEIKRELGLPPNAVLGVTLENYKERVTAPLREQLAQSNRCHADAEEDLASARLRIDELKDQLAHWQDRTRERTGEVERLQSELAQVTQENEKLKAIVSAYENQDEEALEEAENL